MKRSRLTRLERLERVVDDFVDLQCEEITPEDIGQVIIYDPAVGKPPRQPGDTGRRLCLPDNGRGPAADS